MTTRDTDESAVEGGRIRWWSETEHDQECSNGGCPGYEFHRASLSGRSGDA